MCDLQHRERLRPFRKLPDAAVHIAEADEGNEQEQAAEHGGPEEGAEEVVEDQVLRLEAAAG